MISNGKQQDKIVLMFVCNKRGWLHIVWSKQWNDVTWLSIASFLTTVLHGLRQFIQLNSLCFIHLHHLFFQHHNRMLCVFIVAVDWRCSSSYLQLMLYKLQPRMLQKILQSMLSLFRSSYVAERDCHDIRRKR